MIIATYYNVTSCFCVSFRAIVSGVVLPAEEGGDFEAGCFRFKSLLLYLGGRLAVSGCHLGLGAACFAHVRHLLDGRVAIAAYLAGDDVEDAPVRGRGHRLWRRLDFRLSEQRGRGGSDSARRRREDLR